MRIVPNFVRMLFVALVAVQPIGLQAGDHEQNGLRFEGEARLVEVRRFDGERTLPSIYILRVQGLLKNVGQKSLVVATTTPSGHPTSTREAAAEKWMWFMIGPTLAVEKKIQISPCKFAPVILEPGEYAALPEYEFTVHNEEKELLKSAGIGFEVDSEYATKHGWWSGVLQCRVTLTP